MSTPISKPKYVPNPFYVALMTADLPFAVVNGQARRFQREIIPFAAVREPSAEALLDLVPLVALGEEVYLTAGAGEAINATGGLVVVSTLSGLQMRLVIAPAQDEGEPKVVALTSDDIEEMLDLKARAFPGYFGPRATLLGRFFGVRDAKSGRLVAMGGERLATHCEREISAVCTDPKHIGQGHAARIVRAVIRHQASLGTDSILHVTAANKRALSLYEYLGFRVTGAIEFVKVRRV